MGAGGTRGGWEARIGDHRLSDSDEGYPKINLKTKL